MQSHYPERFERDMGCTEADWQRWLPAAIGEHPWRQDGTQATVDLPGGVLVLRWAVQPPRVIALVRLPVLRVGFAFESVDADQRRRFMKRFDLYMQRGGG